MIGNLKRLELLISKPELREKLWTIVKTVQNGLRDKGFDLGVTESPVTPVFFNGNVAMVTNIMKDLRSNYKVFCSAVVYPVIPKGKIMLRIIPTADHTIEQVEKTIQAFTEVAEKVAKGVYDADEVTAAN